jgi:type I restriction enzyme S subunit
MRTQTARLRAVASGSATPLLNKSAFESLSVSVPPLSDQRAIAGILGALDDKIDSNRKLASTLREYGQALLSQVTLLNSTITPLRSVVASVARGVAPSYVEDGDGALVLNQRCIRNGRVELSAARRMTHRTVTPERLAQHGDVLVNSTGTGTLGRVARWNGNTVFVDGHVSVVKPDAEKFPPTVLAYLLLLCQPEIEELAEGSTGQTELSPKRLLDFQLALPKVVDAEKVEPELRDLELRGEKAIQESDALESLREALLPELLSGRLRVKDAESMMECAR